MTRRKKKIPCLLCFRGKLISLATEKWNTRKSSHIKYKITNDPEEDKNSVTSVLPWQTYFSSHRKMEYTEIKSHKIQGNK